MTEENGTGMSHSSENKVRPMVSVLMTAYNRENFIGEAIESVLSSSFTDFELIIVDDCSKDRTVSIARTFEKKDTRIKVYINEKNLGDYPNRNKAASYAKGKYLKYVDSDDKVFEHTLELMVTAMERCPRAGFALSSRTEVKSTQYSPIEAYKCHFYKKGLLDYGPTGTIIRTDVFRSVGGFKHIRNVSDLDFWLRVARDYDLIELQKDLVYWRQHDQQEINLAPEQYVEFELEIIIENLFHPKCPLSKTEVQEVVALKKKRLVKYLLKRCFGKFSFYREYKIWRKYGLSVIDLR